MKCPGTFFIGFFECRQGHGPHDPLLDGGPIHCQSALDPQGTCFFEFGQGHRGPMIL
ncbi:unnamed protein product [Staurois parvus]|uniref:Uncharacterized protein n=1 Tax=Staurois parvus TaxID=386267 RepID=A0ABN9DZ21_9NEOB|nr:unnamed protein product [Staurois parvus]